MAETISEVERALTAERDALERNLDALHVRMRELTDWRGQYRNHTGQWLGAALLGGVVLSIIARRGWSSHRGRHRA